MKAEEFNICLEFHEALIRPTLDVAVKDAAFSYVVNDASLADYTVTERARIKKLAVRVRERYAQLTEFNDELFYIAKAKVYRSATGRPVNIDCVDALLAYRAEGIPMNRAASQHGLNMQTLKSFEKRWVRFEGFADRLYNVDS